MGSGHRNIFVRFEYCASPLCLFALFSSPKMEAHQCGGSSPTAHSPSRAAAAASRKRSQCPVLLRASESEGKAHIRILLKEVQIISTKLDTVLWLPCHYSFTLDPATRKLCGTLGTAKGSTNKTASLTMSHLDLPDPDLQMDVLVCGHGVTVEWKDVEAGLRRGGPECVGVGDGV